MVEKNTVGRAEIISVASGKGGTGKTLILASLGYALQMSGHRILFVDTDTATDGLSLFILGPRGWEVISDLETENTLLGYLRKSDVSPSVMDGITPFKVNRGRQDDHGQIYDLLISGRGLYGDVQEEIDQSAAVQITRESFRRSIDQLFKHLRASNQWDYVLVDTRGGFGFNTTDTCALSDSFFLVTEPDFTSFYQDKNLMYRVAAAATELDRKAVLRGVIVNKATEFLKNDNEAELGIHNLNLDNIEASFRNALVEEFKIRYSDTNPIPLDIEAVQAYKLHKVPYLACPGSVFSYATLVAFSNLMKTVTVRWSDESTKRWNELVDRISAAIKSENDRKRSNIFAQQKLRTEKETLERNYQLLQTQYEDLRNSLERTGEHEQYRLERDKELYFRQIEENRILYFKQAEENRRRFVWILGFGVGLVGAVLGLAYAGYANIRQATEQQLQAYREITAQQASSIAALQSQLDKLRGISPTQKSNPEIQQK